VIRQLLIAGGGIGGLAGALACARAGCDVRLFERMASIDGAGAGVQLGPNVTRILNGWGLGKALSAVASFPGQLSVRDARSGAQTAALSLGAMRERYGAPYATLHRADLHALLLGAVQQGADSGGAVRLDFTSAVAAVRPRADGVVLRLDDEREVEGDALVGADGLWSTVRAQVWQDGPPRATGHVAYRTLLRQSDLPGPSRRGGEGDDVRVWLGDRLHAVAYPVRAGEWLNLVVLAEGRQPPAQGWDQAATAQDLALVLQGACGALRDLAAAASAWRLWSLHDRAPVAGPQAMHTGRVVLLGDAAHPMLPYLAQGAAMAIEDAAALGGLLAMDTAAVDLPTALRRYALNRWQRCARVQARSRRNARLFHADGVLRWGRDTAMRLLGERVLDVPWLYRG